MAHLSRGPDDGDTRGRAQLILVAGFAMAVTLVALALVLNAAIYTENLATRSESVGASNAHAYQRATENVARESFRYAHEVNNSTHADLEANVTDAIETYNNVSVRQAVATGRIVNVSVATTRGTNVTSDPTGDFEDASDAETWTLGSDLTHVRQYRIFVSDTADLGLLGSDDEFRVVADGPGQDWVLNITKNATHAIVGVNASGSYDECTEPLGISSFWVNVSDGTAFGEECAALDIGDAPSPYELRYENADAVTGHYSLILETDVDSDPAVSGGSYGSSGPHARDVLYSMTVDMVYRTSDLAYRTEIRIAPGEGDA